MPVSAPTGVSTAGRWSLSGFLQAHAAGVFGGDRVELVDGEVLSVVIGDWHGRVTAAVIGVLATTVREPAGGWRVTTATLASASSLPDPDCWVQRLGAEPTERLTDRLSRWAADDVGLVVEVGDESFDFDASAKADVYASAGYPAYWVVHRGGVEVFDEPSSAGYRMRRSYRTGDEVPVPYAPGDHIAVDDLLGGHDPQ